MSSEAFFFLFFSSRPSLMMMGSCGAATGTFHRAARPGLLWSLLIVAAAAWYAQLSQQLPCSLETSHHINPGARSPPQPPPPSPHLHSLVLPFNQCFSLHPLSLFLFFFCSQIIRVQLCRNFFIAPPPATPPPHPPTTTWLCPLHPQLSPGSRRKVVQLVIMSPRLSASPWP